MNKKTKELLTQLNPVVDGCFLNKIVKKVYKTSIFKNKLLKIGCYENEFNIFTHKDYYKYDIALNVSMIHWFDWIPLNGDEKKRKTLYKNKDYINSLVSRTLDQCCLRTLLTYGQRVMLYTHIPIIFSMTCIVNYLSAKLDAYVSEHPDYRTNTINDFKVASFRQMFSTMKSVLSQAVLKDYSGAYSSIRILIEDYIIYLVLHGKKKGIKEYIRFTDWQQYYELHGDFPDDYKQDVQDQNIRLQYVDYGWLRVFDRKPKKLYKFRDVVYHSGIKDRDEKEKWIKLHGKFSKYSHGAILDFGTPERDIIEIASFLSDPMVKIFDLYFEAFNEDAIFANVDLKTYFNQQIDDMWNLIETADIYKIKE